MKVAVTGSSGLIGSALVHALSAAGHEPVKVVRSNAGPDDIAWDPAAGTIDAAGFEGVDAVVHLAGAGIGDERWTDERKRVLLESRTKGTSLLANTLANATNGPKVLLSGSAIGYYGNRGDEVLTEESSSGDDFLADICIQWEAAAQPAIEAGIRTAFLRTGIVQSVDGGALAKSLLPFKLGIGGRFGSGEQYWSWVSIDDEIRAIIHLLTADVSGPVNITGPNPVTNQTYTKALGKALGRPTLLPIPMIGPRLLFGKELAQALLLNSDRVLPTVLEDSGFTFRHPTIEACLAAVLAKDHEIAV